MAARTGMRPRRIVGAGIALLCFLALTVLTQVSGIVLLGALATGRLVARRLAVPPIAVHGVLFFAFYLLATLWVVPVLARPFGRVALPCAATETLPLAPAAALTCLLNRHYVAAPAGPVVAQLARDLAAAHPGATVRFLDAGFPFWARFPMLPHLTHRTGRQIDLAFQYRTRGDGTAARPPSPSGYWLYEPARSGEAQPCRNASSWLRWDVLDLHASYPGIVVDEPRTAAMIHLLAASPAVRRILLEPHLQERLGVAGAKVAFAGCGVARHDDHLHVDFE